MSTNNDQIWAKSSKNSDGSPITLYQHTTDVLNAFKALEKFIDDTSILPETHKKLIELTILLHDLGKVQSAFQCKTLKNKKYEPFSVTDEVPHSLYSLLWIDTKKLKEQIRTIVNDEKKSDAYHRFVLSAVAFHHWRENFNDFLSSDNHILSGLSRKAEDWWKAQEINLKSELKELQVNGVFVSQLIRKNQDWIDGLGNGIGLSRYVVPPYQLYYLPMRAKLESKELRDWIFISGFTMLADHFASYCEEEQEDTSKVEILSPDLKAIEQQILRKIDLPKNKIWQFEHAPKFTNENLLLIAPTGYGKTEFSWLWASGKKFFYTLPIRSAVNQNFDRTEAVFGEDKAGILHSDADVYLLGDGGEIDNLKIYDLAKQLSQPAIVSTGDQFFPYALRPPGYEKIFAKFSYSRLVIDEVQAYDPKAAAIVVKFLEHMHFMGGKFLLMTATLPAFIKAEIEKRIDSKDQLNIYENNKNLFSKTVKHSLKLSVLHNKQIGKQPDFILPEDEIIRIISEAKGGKRVLIILNTVSQAQRVYNQLKDIKDPFLQQNKNLWLLHSRFTLNQRKNIENKITDGEFKNPKPENETKGKILVSTQVVEASLDIDADVLFSEITPLDALVQRMGRVMRRKRSDSGYEQPKEQANIHLWIFENGIESGKGYVYHKELLTMSMKMLSDKANDSRYDVDYKEWLSIRDTKKPISISVDEKNKKGPKLKKNEKDSSPIFIDQQPFSISEFEKYEMLEKFYDLPDSADYLNQFYQTLDILDAGYMSDRKNEAQKIFREINDVSVIPEGENDSKKQDFVDDVVDFFKEKQVTKGLYTKFKQKILSNYIVNVRYYNVKDHLVSWNEAYEQVKLELEERGVNAEDRSKLERWLRGIYILPVGYQKESGLAIENIKSTGGVII